MSVAKKKEFIKELALELGTTQADAIVVREAFINVTHRFLVELQTGVPLGKLGNLKINVKAARDYPNLNNPEGNKIKRPAHYTPKYSPSKNLKDELKAITIKA